MKKGGGGQEKEGEQEKEKGVRRDTEEKEKEKKKNTTLERHSFQVLLVAFPAGLACAMQTHTHRITRYTVHFAHCVQLRTHARNLMRCARPIIHTHTRRRLRAITRKFLSYYLFFLSLFSA